MIAYLSTTTIIIFAETTVNFDLVFSRHTTSDFVRLQGVHDLDQFTFVSWLRSRDLDNYGTLLSYATRGNGISDDELLENEITIYDYGYLTVSVLCTLYTVQFIVYTVQCTVSILIL